MGAIISLLNGWKESITLKTKRIFAVGESLVSGSSLVQLLISQNSGKDKPPSIDAAIAPNEHGRARDAASVAHESPHSAQIPSNRGEK